MPKTNIKLAFFRNVILIIIKKYSIASNCEHSGYLLVDCVKVESKGG